MTTTETTQSCRRPGKTLSLIKAQRPPSSQQKEASIKPSVRLNCQLHWPLMTLKSIFTYSICLISFETSTLSRRTPMSASYAECTFRSWVLMTKRSAAIAGGAERAFASYAAKLSYPSARRTCKKRRKSATNAHVTFKTCTLKPITGRGSARTARAYTSYKSRSKNEFHRSKTQSE